MTIPYEKCMVTYEKPTSAYDVFHVLADDHYHVCLSNPLVVSESKLLQRLCIEKGQPNVPHHGGGHHHMNVSIRGVP